MKENDILIAELRDIESCLKRAIVDDDLISELHGIIGTINSDGFDERYDTYLIDSIADELCENGFDDLAERLWDAIADQRQSTENEEFVPLTESKKLNEKISIKKLGELMEYLESKFGEGNIDWEESDTERCYFTKDDGRQVATVNLRTGSVEVDDL